MNQPPRLTVKEIKNETLSYFNFEKGLPFTYVQMLKNPLKAIQGYLYEDRKKYFNPFRYILFATAIYVIIIKINKGFQSVFNDLNETNKKQLSDANEKIKIPLADYMAQTQDLLQSYQNVVYFVLIPLVSVITYKFFNKSKYNYAENLAINAFCFGTTLWTSSIILSLTSFLESKWILIVLSILTYTLLIYFYKKIYQTNWLRSTAMIIFVIISTMIITSIFMIVVLAYKILSAT